MRVKLPNQKSLFIDTDEQTGAPPRVQTDVSRDAKLASPDDHKPAHKHASTSASTDAPKKRDGYQQALDNELHVLEAIDKFGWLTSLLTSLLIWKRLESRMGRITLTRLKKQRHVLKRLLGNGQPAYTLSARGAARLRTHLGIEWVASGKDLRIQHWFHRNLLNLHLITFLAKYPNIVIYSEHEVYTGRVPFLTHDNVGRCQYMRKIPDGLIYEPLLGALTWVEVENARKRRTDMHALLNFIYHAFSAPQISPKVRLVSIHYVVTAEKVSLIRPIATAIRKNIHPDLISQRNLENMIRFQIYDLSPGLIPRGYTHKSLGDIWAELDQEEDQ